MRIMKWTFEAGRRYTFSTPMTIEDYVRADFMGEDSTQAPEDEYEWFVEFCEKMGIEPECFDD